MARSFRVELVARDRVLFTDECVSLVAPGVEGYLGVLGGHAPLITELQVGRLRIRRPDGEVRDFAVSGGFLEVTPEQTTVLVDSAESAPQIDVDRARTALARAVERMERVREEPGIDTSRAQAARQRAMNRLKIAEEADRESAH